MGIIETDAWILHKMPVGDTSYYVTFFTKKKGVVVALCRGIKSSKKQAILQQFTPLWVIFNEKLDKFYVNNIEAQTASLNFSKDNLFASLYINELLYYLLKPEDEHNDLFDAYKESLLNLQMSASQNSMEILLRSFELNLLQAIGYGLGLSIEAESNALVQVDKYYKFIPNRGLVLAQQGILGRYLLAIDKCDFSDDYALKIAKKIIRCALDYCLEGKRLRSRDFFVRP